MLYDIAYNLWWTWSPEARALFSSIESVSWELYRNPVQLLINVSHSRWDELLESETFRSSYVRVVAEFEQYVNGAPTSWFSREHADARDVTIAYFSMEYGVHHSLAVYSGGLGVLSGDHLKAASDLGVPLVAVGLLYRRGYFHQTVDPDGFQQHTYPEFDFHRLPIRPALAPNGRPVVVPVPFPDRDVHAKVWVAQVGRVPLLLLDTDIRANDPADRPISNILYVHGREMRFAQELVLGVAGVRALRALEIEPDVWHMNEGHCTFVQLERLRERMGETGGSAQEAIEQIKRDAVFTTHTPVPAGNEQFDLVLAAKYLVPWSRATELSIEELLALGKDGGPTFNLTALGVRLSSYANAVSRLNAQVCDRMWRHLRPEVREGELSLDAITNGVHTLTWCGAEMRALLTRWLGPAWEDLLLAEEAWARLQDIPDEELWVAHQSQQQRLGRFAQSRQREQFARHGRSPDELRHVVEQFDPDRLTIGFARRFATYKRAALIFMDVERLKRIVAHPTRPIQIFFAGKAHPADRAGQEVIRHIFRLSQEEPLRGRVFFIEDYDMRVASMLVQGCDVWLNTPRRPLEASGTSGQKAAINGALNVSILDGWWPEAYDGENGWVVGDDRTYDDPVEQDHADAAALYRTLEELVAPTYYDRDEAGLPRHWIARMKRSIATITPRFSASRMVRDYVERAYLPTVGGRPD